MIYYPTPTLNTVLTREVTTTINLIVIACDQPVCIFCYNQVERERGRAGYIVCFICLSSIVAVHPTQTSRIDALWFPLIKQYPLMVLLCYSAYPLEPYLPRDLHTIIIILFRQVLRSCSFPRSWTTVGGRPLVGFLISETVVVFSRCSSCISYYVYFLRLCVVCCPES